MQPSKHGPRLRITRAYSSYSARVRVGCRAPHDQLVIDANKVTRPQVTGLDVLDRHVPTACCVLFECQVPIVGPDRLQEGGRLSQRGVSLPHRPRTSAVTEFEPGVAKGGQQVSLNSPPDASRDSSSDSGVRRKVPGGRGTNLSGAHRGATNW